MEGEGTPAEPVRQFSENGRSMDRREQRRDCWPTREETLLLQAALLQGRRAIEAWNEWKADVDIDRLDHGSYRLLPQVYRNLHSQNLHDPWMERLKGVYRKTWYQNRLLFEGIGSVLRLLESRGVETLILRGAALLLHYSRDCGLRPMNDVDILVQRETSQKAIALVTNLGSKPRFRLPETTLPAPEASSCAFEGGGGLRFNLHWRLQLGCEPPRADSDFWRDARPVDIQGVSTSALSPTDQLLCVCVQGARWNPVPPFRWAADAVMILRNAAWEMDWERFVVQARARRVVLPVRHTLRLLRDALDAPVPEYVFRRLLRLRVTRVESIEYAIRTHPPEGVGAAKALLSKYYSSGLAGEAGLPAELLGLARFLQSHWGVKRLWQVPFSGLFKCARKGVRRTLGSWDAWRKSSTRARGC